MRRHIHLAHFACWRALRPLCLLLALIHPLIHGTVFDQGALDSLISFGLSQPDPFTRATEK